MEDPQFHGHEAYQRHEQHGRDDAEIAAVNGNVSQEVDRHRAQAKCDDCHHEKSRKGVRFLPAIAECEQPLRQKRNGQRQEIGKDMDRDRRAPC